MTSPPDEAPEASVALASRSDVGQVRSANEDSCDVFVRSDGARLLIVADGMGGHRGGATASGTVVATMGETFDQSLGGQVGSSPAEMLRIAIQGANAKVYAMAQQDASLEGMGTTVVAFHLGAGFQGTVAHVGDSRAYRLRAGHLEPITTDHSVVAEMQRRGLLTAEEAAVHPRRNEILRSVGVQPEVEIEVTDVDVKPGDRFVLCSDGLSGLVNDPEIAAIVDAEPPESAAESLIRLANERGGPDNITVQILAVAAHAIIEGDPEATADVELSDFGIEQISQKRRERQQRGRLIAAAALIALGAVAYFIFARLGGNEAPTQTPDRTTPTATPRAGDDPPPPRHESANPNLERPPIREAFDAPSPAPTDSDPQDPQASEATPSSPSPAQPNAVDTSETAVPQDVGGAPEDRFEVDRDEPRKGIPRRGAQP